MAHPTASSSDHYFLSGLGSARRRPAHSSVQPNGPNQTLRSGFGLPRLLLATDWIPVIVWALCFHSGISCTLNHWGIWGQTIPVKLPAPKLNPLFYLAVIRGHAESHRNSLPTANIYINIYIYTHTHTDMHQGMGINEIIWLGFYSSGLISSYQSFSRWVRRDKRGVSLLSNPTVWNDPKRNTDLPETD